MKITHYLRPHSEWEGIPIEDNNWNRDITTVCGIPLFLANSLRTSGLCWLCTMCLSSDIYLEDLQILEIGFDGIYENFMVYYSKKFNSTRRNK